MRFANGVPAGFAQTDPHVRPQTSRTAAAEIEKARDSSIDTDARDIEERASIENAGVDDPRCPVERSRNRRTRVTLAGQRPRQTVSGPGGHESEGGAGTDQRGAGLIHGPIAAPDDDEIGAVLGSAPRELMRVAGTGREIDLTAQVPAIERFAQHRGTPFGGVNVGAGA